MNPTNGKRAVPIRKADPQARKKAYWVVAVTTLVGLTLVGTYQHFEPRVVAWVESNADYIVDHPQIVFAFGLVLILPIVLAALYLIVYGHRAVKARLMPPPEYTVIRDTPIRDGATAVVWGRIIQALASAIALAAIGIPILLWYALRQLTAAG